MSTRMGSWALAVAFACCFAITAACEEMFLGFRLLDIEGHRVKWSSPVMGEGGSATYAFANKAMTFPGARNCGRLVPPEEAMKASKIPPDVFAREIAAAFAMWETVANISFHRVDDPEKAGIVVGAQGEPRGIAFTNVEYGAPSGEGGDGNVEVIRRALICFNPLVKWKVGFDGNTHTYDVRYVAAHEAGHAIGLDHPFPSGALMGFRYEERFRTLQAGDAHGAITLYGKRPAGSERDTISLAK